MKATKDNQVHNIKKRKKKNKIQRLKTKVLLWHFVFTNQDTIECMHDQI